MDWMLGTCGCSCDSQFAGHSDIQVHLSTEAVGLRQLPQPLDKGDALDITLRPSSVRSALELGGPGGTSRASMTPRQRDIRDHLKLPSLASYPEPPSCSSEDVEERKLMLLDMLHEFAIEMHSGVYITQLTSATSRVEIHCQLMQDLATLQLDDGTGHIVEFPLSCISQAYRVVKSGDKWYAAHSPLPDGPSFVEEQVVILEFTKRKLAFLFKDLAVSQRFLICMDLLRRRAEQLQGCQDVFAELALPPAAAAAVSGGVRAAGARRSAPKKANRDSHVSM